MAIDTSTKRSSVIGYRLPVPQIAYFPPDGTVSALDRQGIAFCYTGIASDLPVEADEGAHGGMMVNPDRLMGP